MGLVSNARVSSNNDNVSGLLSPLKMKIRRQEKERRVEKLTMKWCMKNIYLVITDRKDMYRMPLTFQTTILVAMCNFQGMTLRQQLTLFENTFCGVCFEGIRNFSFD